MDIEAFIMGVRCLFSWYRLEEFEYDADAWFK